MSKSSMETVNVELDGKAITFSPEESFGSLSLELKNQLGSERVVTEIYIDGRSIDIEEEDRIQEQSLKDLGRLRFVTKEVGSLLKDSLQLAPQICQALQLDCDDIENFFEKGEFVAANDRIAELSSLVDWMLQMVASLQTYGEEDFRQMSFSGDSVVKLVQRMDKLLNQLHAELQAQSFDNFRNILKNEFKPELVQWHAMFSEAAKCWTPRTSQRAS